MNARRLLISVGASACVVALGGIIMAGAIHSSKSGADTGALPASAPAANVRLVTLAPSVLEDTLMLTGSVAPWEEVTLSAELAGSIEWQGIDDGAPVDAGQELLRIDTESLRARHAQTESQLKLADLELTRVQALSRNGVSSPQELDRAQANQLVAATDLRVSEIALTKSVVKAPLSGIADRVFHEVAEFVDVGAPLARIVQVDRVKVMVGIPEREAPLFSVGNSIDVSVDALPDKTFTGTIYRIATTAEPSTRTFVTEVEVSNAERLLRPGMIARVKLVRNTYPDAIAIPIYSVISLEDRHIVFVEDGGTATARLIELGFYQGTLVHVTSGLSAGDRLIVAGQRDLRDGQAVVVQAANE